MFKSPIEWLKEMISELVKDFANMAFDWIGLFMLKPTDFSKYPFVNTAYDFVFSLASSLCIVFVAWSLLNVMLNHLAGVQSRSVAEVVTKTIFAFVLSAAAPWLLDNVLLKLNNAIVSYFLDKGLNTKALEKLVMFPGTTSLSIVLAVAVIVVLFTLLSLQYIQRLGEYIVLLVTSPIAAYSLITENFEIWSVWWREAISVIFSQAFQVALLWMIINMLTGTEKLSDYFMAIGLMVVLLKGPKYIRQFLYSSGAGKMAVGMAGGASKMAVYKYAAAKVTGR
ncbi:conjugal transfer protein TrbL family protein [Peribacillus asahii]|uniref:conjugal transfer protein TrbL family protein n=1 Tax=Peribacillus asahii TaxID=228899 RepID=UPI00207A4E3A|nr:conjugal transfer protein TrbL family protein [Peribacillus asahii]USK72630.1 hypothetical protein LIS76_23585 [Peribacillus asahii]USK72746.1 hypothetical protein LIS76_23765 [Peribacillus asahii]